YNRLHLGAIQLMKPKTLYLVLAIVGLVGPYYFFLSFLRTNGADPGLFVQQLFGTPASSFFVVDLLISSVVFIIYLWTEAARHSMRRIWPYMLALFTVGLSFALPLFLYVRESSLHEKSSLS